jgi:hypothetical protein
LITNNHSSTLQTYRNNAATGPEKAPPTEPLADRNRDSVALPVEDVVVVVKEEPIDPLNMDLEEEAQIDLEVTASQLNQDVRVAFFPYSKFFG